MKKYIYAVLIIPVGLILALLFISNESPTSNKDTYLTPVAELRDAHGLAVDVEDSNKLWIASHTGLHMLKNDKELFLVGSGRDDYMGFSTDPNDPNTFYTSGHPVGGGNLGFQKSTDAGRTWQNVSSGLNGPVDFHSMTVDRVNPNIVYGVYQGRMQKSADGGKDWQYADAAPTGVIQLASGATENSVVAATNNGLVVSKDQGKNWASVSPELEGAAVIAVGVNPNDANELIAFSQKIGFTKTVDGGASWVSVPTPFGNETILYVAYDSNNSSNVYVLTQSLAIYRTTDGGLTWTDVNYQR